MACLHFKKPSYGSTMVAITYEENVDFCDTDIIDQYLPYTCIAIVCDQNTYDALGKRLYERLNSLPNKTIQLVNLGQNISARLDIANSLITKIKECNGIIAVGSGTINDLCKYASYKKGIPYIVFPTATSMNGYISSTASLSVGRQKTSILAQQPRLVVCDMETLTSAPHPMIRAGVGDMACRSTVQADWLLSHRLLGTEYNPVLFKELQPLEREVFEHGDKLSERDPFVIKLLMDLLIMSGETMAEAGNSAPASQGEHMIAHTMEILYASYTKDRLHGEQIAVTTLMMAKTQEKLLLKKPLIRTNQRDKKLFATMFGTQTGNELYEVYQQKVMSDEQVARINDMLEDEWPSIKEQLQSVMTPSTNLDILLRKANLPTTYKNLRWTKNHIQIAVNHAYMTRDRFTFLDVAAMDKSLRFIVD